MKIIPTENCYTTDKEITCLEEYIEAIGLVQDLNNNHAWFRGHEKENYKLLPTIYRKESWMNDYKYSSHLENNLFQEFKRKSRLNLNSDYAYYQTMQHYSFPTRLLDWSESALVALFFSILRDEFCDNPVVWSIQPYYFNGSTINLSGIHYFYKSNEYQEQVIKKYFPNEGFSDIPDEQISVIPWNDNDRVINQKSTFILFGKDQTPIEENKDWALFFLTKIRINQGSIRLIRQSIYNSGFSNYDIYPDLNGLLMDIKHLYKLK